MDSTLDRPPPAVGSILPESSAGRSDLLLVPGQLPSKTMPLPRAALAPLSFRGVEFAPHWLRLGLGPHPTPWPPPSPAWLSAAGEGRGVGGFCGGRQSRPLQNPLPFPLSLYCFAVGETGNQRGEGPTALLPIRGADFTPMQRFLDIRQKGLTCDRWSKGNSYLVGERLWPIPSSSLVR